MLKHCFSWLAVITFLFQWILVNSLIWCQTIPEINASQVFFNEDLDGDGKNDQIIYDFSGGGHCCYHISIRLTSNPNRLYAFPFDLDGARGPMDQHPSSVVIKDFDGDSRAEIALSIYTYNGELHEIPKKIKKKFQLKSNIVLIDFASKKLNLKSIPDYLTADQYFLQKKFSGFPSELIPYKKNGAWGYQSQKGAVYIKPIFDEAYEMKEGRGLVKYGRSIFLLNNQGKVIQKMGQTNDFYLVKGQSHFQNGQLLLRTISNPEQLVFFNREGKKVHSKKYEDAKPFSEGIAAVKHRGKWGYVDPNHHWHIPPQFEAAHSFSKGKALVEVQNQIYLIKKTGERVE